MKTVLFCIILKLYIELQDTTCKLHTARMVYPDIQCLTLAFVTYRLAELLSNLVQISTDAAPWMVGPVGSAFVCLMARCGEAFFNTQEPAEGFLILEIFRLEHYKPSAGLRLWFLCEKKKFEILVLRLLIPLCARIMRICRLRASPKWAYSTHAACAIETWSGETPQSPTETRGGTQRALCQLMCLLWDSVGAWTLGCPRRVSGRFCGVDETAGPLSLAWESCCPSSAWSLAASSCQTWGF